MLADNERIPDEYKMGGRLSSEFLDGVDYAEQRIMEKGVEVWLARDGSGILCAYLHKPICNMEPFSKSCYWIDWVSNKMKIFRNRYPPLELDRKSFPEVTFENSPQKARIILEN